MRAVELTVAHDVRCGVLDTSVWVRNGPEERAAASHTAVFEMPDTSAPATVVSIPFKTSGPRVARRAVERFTTERNLHGMTDDLSLIVDELVTNAIVYGAEPVQLTLSYDNGEITIEVADGDPRIDRVTLRTTCRAEPGGRGLRIVAALADRWGTRSSRSGKTVWAITH